MSECPPCTKLLFQPFSKKWKYLLPRGEGACKSGWGVPESTHFSLIPTDFDGPPLTLGVGPISCQWILRLRLRLHAEWQELHFKWEESFSKQFITFLRCLSNWVLSQWLCCDHQKIDFCPSIRMASLSKITVSTILKEIENTFSFGEKVPVRADEGFGKYSFPAFFHPSLFEIEMLTQFSNL